MKAGTWINPGSKLKQMHQNHSSHNKVCSQLIGFLYLVVIIRFQSMEAGYIMNSKNKKSVEVERKTKYDENNSIINKVNKVVVSLNPLHIKCNYQTCKKIIVSKNEKCCFKVD